MVSNLIQKYGAEHIITCLAPYLTDRRKERILELITNRILNIHVAIESPSNLHNALAVVRTSDVLGLHTIHVVDWSGKQLLGKKTTQGAYRWTDMQFHENVSCFAETMKGFCIAGASPDGEVSLEELPVDQPICLLFGNELTGLSSKALNICDMSYRIPQYGMSQSFNLSVSAAISLYELVRRKRKLLSRNGDVLPQEVNPLKAFYFIKTIGVHKAKHYCDITSR